MGHFVYEIWNALPHVPSYEMGAALSTLRWYRAAKYLSGSEVAVARNEEGQLQRSVLSMAVNLKMECRLIHQTMAVTTQCPRWPSLSSEVSRLLVRPYANDFHRHFMNCGERLDKDLRLQSKTEIETVSAGASVITTRRIAAVVVFGYWL